MQEASEQVAKERRKIRQLGGGLEVARLLYGGRDPQGVEDEREKE